MLAHTLPRVKLWAQMLISELCVSQDEPRYLDGHQYTSRDYELKEKGSNQPTEILKGEHTFNLMSAYLCYTVLPKNKT